MLTPLRSPRHYPSQGDLRHGPSQGFAFPPTPETSPDPQHQPYAYQSLASLSHNSGRLSSDWESNSGGWNRSVSPFDSSFGLLQESADESRYLLVWEIPSTDPAAVKQAFTVRLPSRIAPCPTLPFSAELTLPFALEQTLGDVRAILIKFLESHGAVGSLSYTPGLSRSARPRHPRSFSPSMIFGTLSTRREICSGGMSSSMGPRPSSVSPSSPKARSSRYVATARPSLGACADDDAFHS